jgi:hypothetical protein
MLATFFRFSGEGSFFYFTQPVYVDTELSEIK